MGAVRPEKAAGGCGRPQGGGGAGSDRGEEGEPVYGGSCWHRRELCLQGGHQDVLRGGTLTRGMGRTLVPPPPPAPSRGALPPGAEPLAVT